MVFFPLYCISNLYGQAVLFTWEACLFVQVGTTVWSVSEFLESSPKNIMKKTVCCK